MADKKLDNFELSANLVNMIVGLGLVFVVIQSLFGNKEIESAFDWSMAVVLLNLLYFGIKGNGLRIFTVIMNIVAIFYSLNLLSNYPEELLVKVNLALLIGICLLTSLALMWPRNRLNKVTD